jgi:hypothetical protein
MQTKKIFQIKDSNLFSAILLNKLNLFYKIHMHSSNLFLSNNTHLKLPKNELSMFSIQIDTKTFS